MTQLPPNGPPPRREADAWLVRPRTIRLLWFVFTAILALSVIADLFVDRDPELGLTATIGFGAWFGFLSCVALVFISRVLGALLKRPDDYYGD